MGLVVNSLGARITVGGLRWDHRAIRWWSARAARLFGIRIKVLGTPLPGGVLFVANHINWLDIVLLHSQHMMGFVAKAEIARRSEEHTSELQSLMRNSYAVFCLKKKKKK